MKFTDIENYVRQITWPAPPESLRGRVLAAAAVDEEPISWSDRMWFSRTCRLSALATALLVLVMELQPNATSQAEGGPTPQALADARGVEEIGRQAGLPQDAAASLARRMLWSPGAASQERVTLSEISMAGGEKQ